MKNIILSENRKSESSFITKDKISMPISIFFLMEWQFLLYGMAILILLLYLSYFYHSSNIYLSHSQHNQIREVKTYIDIFFFLLTFFPTK